MPERLRQARRHAESRHRAQFSRPLSAPPNSAAWAAAWRPYVEPCIELFGAERCTFESNFPVDKMGTGYATLWNAFKRVTAGCSQTEKLALYSGTAKRLYHLD
jgi:predicted TIM-barrel fold metal-dependent hydrolase